LAAATGNGARKKILLLDNHPITLFGLGRLINAQADMTVCHEGVGLAGTFSGITKHEPSLLIMDMIVEERSGIELIKDLLVFQPGLAILIFSLHDESVFAERALRSGARGYIMKKAGLEVLLAGIREVLAGKTYVSANIAAMMVETMTAPRPRGSRSPVAKLSDREFEVFLHLGQGQSSREIATRLHLSPKTVDVHRGHIKRKLELKDATALIRHAVRWVETQGNGEGRAVAGSDGAGAG
jgi:DNA-binding NarL/FixJ family response regulator